MQNLGQSGAFNPKEPMTFTAPMRDTKVDQLTNAVSTANNLGEIFTLSNGQKGIFRNAVLDYYQKKYKEDPNTEFQLQEGTLKKEDVLKMLEKTSTAPIQIQKEILESALICAELFLFSQKVSPKLNLSSFIQTIESLYGINFLSDVLSPQNSNFPLIQILLQEQDPQKEKREVLACLSRLSQFQDLNTLKTTFKNFSGQELKDVLLACKSPYFDGLFTTVQFCKTFPGALKQSDKTIFFDNTDFKKSILKLHAENKFELLLKTVKLIYEFDLSSAPFLSSYSSHRPLCEKVFKITPESFDALKLLDRVAFLKAEPEQKECDLKDLSMSFACWQNDHLGDVLFDSKHSRFESLKTNLEFAIQFPKSISKGLIFKELDFKKPLLQLKKDKKFEVLQKALDSFYKCNLLEDLFSLFNRQHNLALNVVNSHPQSIDLFLKLDQIREHKDFQVFQETFEKNNGTTFQDVLFNPQNLHPNELFEKLKKEVNDFGKAPVLKETAHTPIMELNNFKKVSLPQKILDISNVEPLNDKEFAQWVLSHLEKEIKEIHKGKVSKIINELKTLESLSCQDYLTIQEIIIKLYKAELEKNSLQKTA